MVLPVVKRAIRQKIEVTDRRRHNHNPASQGTPSAPAPQEAKRPKISEKEWTDFLLNNPPFFH